MPIETGAHAASNEGRIAQIQRSISDGVAGWEKLRKAGAERCSTCRWEREEMRSAIKLMRDSRE